jgi:hypothetical protein
LAAFFVPCCKINNTYTKKYTQLFAYFVVNLYYCIVVICLTSKMLKAMLLINFIARNLAAIVALLTALLAVIAAINGAYAAAFILSLSACAGALVHIRK